MIYILTNSENYNYEIEHTIRLFYPLEDFNFLKDCETNFKLGILIKLSLYEYKDNIRIETEIYKSGEKSCGRQNTINFSANKDIYYQKKQIKKRIKRELYLALSKYTKRSLPWGVLMGIKPVKIAHELLDNGVSIQTAIQKLQEEYFISKEKATLLIEVAQVENEILNSLDKQDISMYIGIPFCSTRCLYCSFTSNSVSTYYSEIDNYIEALKREISIVMGNTKNSIQSIYIGGGTPTAINATQLYKLLKFLDSKVDFSKVKEFTLEAGRPDSIDLEKLKIIKESRVSRISINPQTMNNNTLWEIGRKHTAEDVIKTYYLARELGFNNINMDIIAGLPSENVLDFENTMSKIVSLNPESITVHALAIKRAARLKSHIDKYSIIEENEAIKMVNMAKEYTETNNMRPYYLYRQKNIAGNLENIGYSKRGFECIFNIQTMEDRQTVLAFGAGGVSKVIDPSTNKINRNFNTKDVRNYIQNVEEIAKVKASQVLL